MFKGSYVALVTPLLASGEVDNANLERLVQWHIESGTHGIVAVGTTGESATLPMDEHIDVVKQIVSYAQGQVPIIAGSGCLLYTSPSPRDRTRSRMPSSA